MIKIAASTILWIYSTNHLHSKFSWITFAPWLQTIQYETISMFYLILRILAIAATLSAIHDICVDGEKEACSCISELLFAWEWGI